MISTTSLEPPKPAEAPTDPSAILKELAHAKAEAEQASRAKSEFLSRMSHELCTPMNAILGFTQLLEMDDLSPSQRNSLAHITSASRHLLSLINDMLDISGAPDGRKDLVEESVGLRALLGEANRAQQAAAARRGVALTPPSATSEGLAVIADPRRLLQVLGHLLSNAIKFNHPGGTASISCKATETGRVRITVEDTGCGIAAENFQKLFLPFERLNAGARGIEGAGLGLALSKRLVEAMGGTISVESTLEAGTSFHLELPSAVLVPNP
jgi:signal transduction histidine kinase